MKYLPILLAAGTIGQVGALPSGRTCTTPSKRIEWRELDAVHQQSYIEAVLCLKTKPSRMGLSTPLYDDFSHLHFKLNQYSEYIGAEFRRTGPKCANLAAPSPRRCSLSPLA